MERLDDLPTTSAGHVPKRHALRWLSEVPATEPNRIVEAFVPKPKGFTGSKFPTPVSELRATGEPDYIEAVAGLVKPVFVLENDVTRLDLKLQEIEDREAGALTGNFALYLSVAERG